MSNPDPGGRVLEFKLFPSTIAYRNSLLKIPTFRGPQVNGSLHEGISTHSQYVQRILLEFGNHHELDPKLPSYGSLYRDVTTNHVEGVYKISYFLP